jgi:acyl-CoA synthetase (AMP-forming)/AMP-acid ligase II
VPGVDIAIRDESGREVEDGTEGRIFVRGPSVMKGYFADPDTTAQVLQRRWLDTGDLGFIDAEQLYVSGRAKDVIIIRGANRMPQEFEEPLLDVDGVRAGCVVAVGEQFADEGGEGLLILAERAHAAERRDDEIAEAIRRRLAERTGIQPSHVHLLEPGALPRTSSGKLRRAEALRRFRGDALEPGQRVNVLTMSSAMLRSALAYRRFKRARRRTAEGTSSEALD